MKRLEIKSEKGWMRITIEDGDIEEMQKVLEDFYDRIGANVIVNVSG